MLNQHPQAEFAQARLASPQKRQRPADSAQDEIHCTLCDCTEFRPSRITTICTCGHHYEDHEIPESMRKKGSRS